MLAIKRNKGWILAFDLCQRDTLASPHSFVPLTGRCCSLGKPTHKVCAISDLFSIVLSISGTCSKFIPLFLCKNFSLSPVSLTVRSCSLPARSCYSQKGKLRNKFSSSEDRAATFEKLHAKEGNRRVSMGAPQSLCSPRARDQHTQGLRGIKTSP